MSKGGLDSLRTQWDPMFFVDGVYLKNQNRIMAMAMIMGLALMVYSLAELKLRSAFEIHKEVFLDQYRKPNIKPTFRRVLQTWSGIHVWYLKMDGQLIEEKVINLRPENIQVLRLLGPEYRQMYADVKGVLTLDFKVRPRLEGDEKSS